MSKSRDAGRYREDAARFRERAAAAADDADLRESYLAVAKEFERLADLLEGKPAAPPATKPTATRRNRSRLLSQSLWRRSHGAVENLPDPEEVAEVSGEEPSATRSLTVLVIDADPAVRLAAKSVLEPGGLMVITVADARAALERLAVLRADLVICDVDALAADGRDAISAIADVDPAAQILTLVPKNQGTAGLSCCIANALEKPFTASELLRQVRRTLAGLAPPPSLKLWSAG